MEEKLAPNTSWIMIPPHIATLDIPNGAKLIFGRIFALCSEEGVCSAYNRELSKGTGLTQATTSEYVRLLVKQKVVGIKLIRNNALEVIDRKLWILLPPPQSGLDTSPIRVGDLPN